MTEGQYHWCQYYWCLYKIDPIFNHCLAIQRYSIIESYKFLNLLDF